MHIVIGGFFDAQSFEGFVSAREAAYDELGCPANEHVTLVDMREMSIQSQTAVASFAALMADPRLRSKKLAFVVSPNLTRSQIARAAAGRNALFFETLESARSWLLQHDYAVSGESRH